MTQRKKTLQNRFVLGLAGSLLLPLCLANMALANSSQQDLKAPTPKAQKFQTTGKEEPKK